MVPNEVKYGKICRLYHEIVTDRAADMFSS